MDEEEVRRVTPVRRPEAVTGGWISLVERASARARWLAMVARTPQLSQGPPVALGRRCRVRLGTAGTFQRGTGVVVGDGLSALVDGPLSIGSDVYINRDANIAVYAGLSIGSGCRFGERLSIHDEDHATDGSADYLTSAVTIGRDVWVGANVVILRGVSIGDGAVIAAGAVVRGDVPPGALAAGVPARTVRRRNATGRPRESSERG